DRVLPGNPAVAGSRSPTCWRRLLKLNSTNAWLLSASSLALAACPLAAQAQDTAKPDSIIVTGVTMPTAEEKVGQTVTVITRELIEDQGYNFIPDVLRQAPGAAVSQMGAPGALTQVRIRGA